jgi:Tol biopolymer transport system component
VLAAPAQATYPGKNGRIAFQRVSGSGTAQIYTMNADGSDQRNLTNDPTGHYANPVWSPDGSRIAFGRHIPGTTGLDEIYTMNADGSNKVNLTNNLANSPMVGDFTPAWSPDGTRIAFVRSLRGVSEIYTMNADGSNKTKLSNRLNTFDGRPTWSPDGGKIVFSRQWGDGLNTWVMNADGSQPINISNNTRGWDDEFPTWSPDGSMIAFARIERGSEGGSRFTHQAYVMNSDGSNQTDLSRNLTVHEGAPAWSPSGTRMLVVRTTVAAATGFDSQQIYVMNPDSSNKVNLTNDPTVRASGPVWSPDGARIAFLRSIPGNNQIYLVNANGSGQTNISNSPTVDGAPDWQPIPGPQRADFKNAAQFCKAEQAFWGDQFESHYGGGRNAYGKCVSAR